MITQREQIVEDLSRVSEELIDYSMEIIREARDNLNDYPDEYGEVSSTNPVSEELSLALGREKQVNRARRYVERAIYILESIDR